MRETFVEAKVTYTLEHDGKFYIIEHVPARVCQETGETYFSPQAVEHIQALIKSNKNTDRVIQSPVYEYVRIFSHPALCSHPVKYIFFFNFVMGNILPKHTKDRMKNELTECPDPTRQADAPAHRKISCQRFDAK